MVKNSGANVTMSDKHQQSCDKFKLISNRLRLAKNLLEDSDKLPGAEAYKTFDSENTLPHERHERESVVIYLLLTCLDLFGQTTKHLTFADWLNSKKDEYVSQREDVISKIEKNADPIETTKTLLSAYNTIYGVTNSFFRGINKLPEEAREYLFSNIQISESVLEADGSRKTLIKNNDETEANIHLKMKYLFSLRNSFTHSLAQHHTASSPMMSIFGNDMHSELAEQPRASWGFYVGDSVVVPWGANQQRQGNFLYSVNDLIFILFEILHFAIGEEFNRDDIIINFFIFTEDNKFYPSVPSKDLDKLLKLNFGVTRPRWNN
jgi:hypothetical protein